MLIQRLHKSQSIVLTMKSVRIIVPPIIAMCIKKYKTAKMFEKQTDIRKKLAMNTQNFQHFVLMDRELSKTYIFQVTVNLLYLFLEVYVCCLSFKQVKKI